MVVSYLSIRGLIRSRWALDAEGRLTLNVTIPANTTATVYIPAADAAQVREGGQPLADASGVRVVGVEGGAVVCQVGGGEYTFRVVK